MLNAVSKIQPCVVWWLQESIEYGLIDAIISKPQLLQQRDLAAIAS